MLTKDCSKWNFDTLQELIEGPLLNPKRMEEAIKVSRFMRRLMSFFHPFSHLTHRFCDMARVKVNICVIALRSILSLKLFSYNAVKPSMGKTRMLTTHYSHGEPRWAAIPSHWRLVFGPNRQKLRSTWSCMTFLVFQSDLFWRLHSSMVFLNQIPYFRKSVYQIHWHTVTSKCWGLSVNTRKALSEWH